MPHGRVELSLFSELKRRHVFRVAFAYIVGAWLILQVTEVLVELLELPLAAGKFIIMLLVLGFIPAVVLSWVYELTDDGLKRDSEVDPAQRVRAGTGRKLNILIVALLALTAAYFLWEARFKAAPPSTATVETFTADPAALPAAGEAATGAVQEQSIAVLPFVNMSADTGNEYFADGLSEEILNRLAQVPQLRVIGRTSSFAFKGDNRDLRDIGQLLDVANVLEGSVRRQGDAVRVTAQLIDTGNGTHLWSQTYDRELEDVFQVQDDIAQRVVDALDIVLDEEQRQRMLNAGVRNVDAFVAYQQGWRLLVEAHDGDRGAQYGELEEANRYFALAAELAPPFAAALADMSDLYAHQLLDVGVSPAVRQAGLQSARALLDRAYEAARDPTRKAMINLDRTFYMDDWSRLPARMEEAFNSPGTATANWMELLIPLADTETLTEHFERQLIYEPAFTLSHFILVQLYLRQGRRDKAVAVAELARTIDPDHRWVVGAQYVSLLAQGKYEQIRKQFDDDAPVSRANIELLALEGRPDEARAAFEQWRTGRPDDPRQFISLLAWLGDREGANREAAQLDQVPGGSMQLLRVINNCRCGAPFDLASTPNFAARLEEAGFSWPPPQLLNFPAKDW